MTAKERNINKLADHLFRENSGKMVAVLSRTFGLQHIDHVMDVVQDTFETALTKWKYSGIPDNPSGWLMQVAKNKAINLFKREGKVAHIDPSLFTETYHATGFETPEGGHSFPPHEIEDSQLRLLLTCCHPEFSDKNQVMLTLHILSGFGVTEIANALMMNKEAVKKALTRCKALLKEKGNILKTPLLLQYEKRIRVVHTILYLMFNEGYKATRSKEMINHDLCYEAVRLARLLLKKEVALKNESTALLSLMFFNLARFPARITTEGEIITLAEQDRGKWNKAFIEEGYFYLNQATKGKALSRYHLEAIIASLHCASESFEKTDWKTIVYMYEQLETIAPSPLVTLNKIVAKSYWHKSFNGIGEIDRFKKEKSIQRHYLLHAAKGDMLKRSGKSNEAKKSFEHAYQLAASPLDKQFLKKKIGECKSINKN